MLQQEKNVKVNGKRWAGYAAAGVAALSASAETAEADITHVVVNQNWGTNDLYYGLVAPASLNFFHNGSFGAYVGVYVGGSIGGDVVGFNANGYNYLSNLAAGANVSTQAFRTSVLGTLAYNSRYTNRQFLNTGRFFGFSFDAGAGLQFGWGRVTSNLDSPVNTYTIVDYAFADPGESIAVGQIPEPTSLGLLALGACGVMINRRRRKA